MKTTNKRQHPKTQPHSREAGLLEQGQKKPKQQKMGTAKDEKNADKEKTTGRRWCANASRWQVAEQQPATRQPGRWRLPVPRQESIMNALTQDSRSKRTMHASRRCAHLDAGRKWSSGSRRPRRRRGRDRDAQARQRCSAGRGHSGLVRRAAAPPAAGTKVIKPLRHSKLASFNSYPADRISQVREEAEREGERKNLQRGFGLQ